VIHLDLSTWPTIPEVAETLGLGIIAVRAIILRGDLRAKPCFEGGRYHKRVDPASLSAFMAARKRVGPGTRGGYKWIRA
jgi:hypothetical protein